MARNAPKKGDTIFVKFDDNDPSLTKVTVLEVVGDMIVVEAKGFQGVRHVALLWAIMFNEQGEEL